MMFLKILQHSQENTCAQNTSGQLPPKLVLKNLVLPNVSIIYKS